MSQGLSESLGAPAQRVRREFLGVASSGERSPGALPAWSEMISHTELEAAGLGELPLFPLQTLWRVGENQDKPQDFHSETLLVLLSYMVVEDVSSRQLQAGKPDGAVRKFTAG